MGRLFDMNNKFFTFMSRVADLCILNVLCIIFCIPVITAGASITAMFYVTMKMVRNEEAYIVKGFFKSFKENFKQATGILYVDTKGVKTLPQPADMVMQVIFMVFSLLIAMVFLYIYPVLAKFYNTTRQTFINAFLMSVRHLPYTIVMLLISMSPYLIFKIESARVQSQVIMLFVLMGAALIAYINSHFLVKIFDHYIPAEENEETQEGSETIEADR